MEVITLTISRNEISYLRSSHNTSVSVEQLQSFSSLILFSWTKFNYPVLTSVHDALHKTHIFILPVHQSFAHYTVES